MARDGRTRRQRRPLPSGLSGEQASLLLPAGHRGPAFLVLHNFRAILKYNNSSAYALAVGLLADSFKGGGRIVGAWLEDVSASSRPQRTSQRQPADDPGAVDGMAPIRARRSALASRKFGCRRTAIRPRCAARPPAGFGAAGGAYDPHVRRARGTTVRRMKWTPPSWLCQAPDYRCSHKSRRESA